ncbi:glycosyltransferase family 9 protein [Amycolatopsis cynarae]|uniref:Glycosyltransferase family 9 protein n=1 Tax=Amycolatopsis cynarae TaxID=2995223 RepID=A0ABY7B4N5_9PSEU|nr:glycosyltransferase family 9 protein [Amycolatopsis sp. HUAS 11-8]WAL66899.1 glycosyltransferase family 9 protein [Amycolatopsis sp. HUAS 11-8]
MTSRTRVPVIGPLPPPFPDVHRIAVLRGGGLGDLLFAVPAIQSLEAAYPGAEILLLGTRMHAELFACRPSPIDRVIPLPPAKGVHEPPGRDFDDAEQQAFFDLVGPVDLGVQVHGGGRWSNPFLRRLGPRWTVGARTPDAEELDRWVPFRYYQNETARALEVAGLAGAPVVAFEPSLSLVPEDLTAAENALAGLGGPLAVVHPGASDPRRRWPPEEFAEVVVTLAGEGVSVAVIGTAEERQLVDKVVSLARGRLSGPGAGAVRPLTELTLSALCGVLGGASVFVGNDSGPRHLARALGTPAVGVYWMGNVINAGPLGRSRDRVLIAWRSTCPVCGVDVTREDLPRCPHDVSFVADVRVADVLAETRDLLAAGRSTGSAFSSGG